MNAIISKLFCRYTRALGIACIMTATAAAAQAADSALSAQAIAFANQNLAAYKQAVQYARNGPKPEVPVPPEIDPPCHVCGDTTTTNSEADVDQWVKQSMEPEATYSKKIGSIAKEVAGFRSGNLSDQARQALSPFGDEKSSLASMALLAERVYEKKALPMAEKYDTDPKRAYAGIQFLLSATRDYLLLAPNLPVKTVASDEYALSLVKKWVQTISDKMEQDIFEGKKYNLCPGYVAVIRQLLLLGGSEPDLNKLQATVEKIEKMMYFDVNVSLHVHVVPANGSGGGDETWSGKAKLHLKIDYQNACYTPEYVDGGQMTISVKDFSLHDDEGHAVGLASARSYNIPLGQPTVNLCDANPILDTGISSAGIPNERIIVKGKNAPSMLLSAYLNIASMKNALDQGLPIGAGAAMASNASAQQGSNFANAAQQIQKIQQEIMAHSGDPSWANSPDGQAAMAAMQNAAAGMRQNAAAMNQGAPTRGQHSLGTLRAPWTNGDTQPVQRNVQAEGDEGNLRLKITVENAPQE